MKIKYTAALLFLIATPALSVTDNGVTFTCAITGSGDSGFDIYATNPGPSAKVCSATCRVTKNDGTTKDWEYSSRTVKAGQQRFWFGGESGVSGAPLKNPEITKASCN